MHDLLFDVDNTLYPIALEVEDWYFMRTIEYARDHLGLPEDGLADQLEQYFYDYGAVMTGLLLHHDASARDFYEFKGRVPLDLVPIDTLGVEKIRRSDRRHFALTNASRGHAEHVIAHLGLREHFHGIFGLDDVGFRAKPSKENTRRIINLAQLEAENTIFIEDSLRNLAYPKRIGMKTILIGDRYVAYGEAPDFIDIHVPNLSEAMDAVDGF